MDEQVDVYKENEKFTKLLDLYNSTRDDNYIKEMWPIMFRCACNVLKIRFGYKMSWEDISDHAINMCEILFNRIKNKDKYPNGYTIINLPTMVKFTILNEFYGPNKLKENKEDAHQSFDDIEKFMGYEVDEDGYIIPCNEIDFYNYSNDVDVDD